MESEQSEFKFLEASWILMISTFIGSMLFCMFLIVKMQKAIDIPKNPFIGIPVVALVLGVPVLISRLVSFSKTTVILNKKEIKIKRNSLIGLPIKPDFQLPYSQIQSFVFLSDQNWYWLKMKASNGKVYRIWKFAHFNNIEFKDFRDRFSNELRWYNQEMANTDNHDRLGQNPLKR